MAIQPTTQVDREDWKAAAVKAEPGSEAFNSIHTRVTETLSRLLANGVWQPGERIPGERELADHFGISIITANKSVSALERQGRLIRRGGRAGTIVAPLPNMDNAPFQIVIAMHCPLNLVDADYYSVGIMAGIQSALARKRFSVSAIFIEDWSPRDFAHLSGSRSCGLLLVAPNVSRLPEIEKLIMQGVNTVVVGASWPTAVVPNVDSDNLQGMDLALEYLVELGHRSIACVYAWPESSNHRDRLQAFRIFAARNRLNIRADWILERKEANIGASKAKPDAVHPLLIGAGRPTAIVSTDYNAVPIILNEVKLAGLNIPNDLSLITFDNPFPHTEDSIALTTVAQPLEIMGARAVEKLINLCASPADSSDVILPMRLHKRVDRALPHLVNYDDLQYVQQLFRYT